MQSLHKLAPSIFKYYCAVGFDFQTSLFIFIWIINFLILEDHNLGAIFINQSPVLFFCSFRASRLLFVLQSYFFMISWHLCSHRSLHKLERNPWEWVLWRIIDVECKWESSWEYFCYHVVSRKVFTSVTINVPYFKPCKDWWNLFSGIHRHNLEVMQNYNSMNFKLKIFLL